MYFTFVFVKFRKKGFSIFQEIQKTYNVLMLNTLWLSEI